MNRRCSKAAVWARLGAAAATAVMINAAAAFSQGTAQRDTIRVLFRIDASGASNINAALAPANSGNNCAGQTRTVQHRAQDRDTLLAVFNANTSSILRGQQRQGATALIRQNRKSVSLSLNPQMYRDAAIELHSVNGRLVLQGKASAANGNTALSRPNLAPGAYLLSVKGADGNTFTAKVAHAGGRLDINTAFEGDGISSSREIAALADCGAWTLTITASGYETVTRTVDMNAASNKVVNLGAIQLTQNNQQPPPPGSAVAIQYSSSGTATVTNPYQNSGVSVAVSGQNVTVTSTTTTTNINYVLSGNTTSGSFKLYSEFRCTLTLSGVSITNPSGAAINIQSGKRTDVKLQGSNSLTDGTNYTMIQNEDMKGTFFSEGQLIFDGTGSLNVTSRSRHGIVSDDWVRITNGNITITAETDGIHSNQSFDMSGGSLTITAKSDGIDVEKEGGAVEITGGTLKMTVTGNQGPKGIKSPGTMTIAGGSFDFTISGNAYHNATERDNKSPAGFKSDGNMIIRGTPTIKVTASGTGGKGINSGGTLDIRGGTIDITTTGRQFSQSMSSNVTNGWRNGDGCGTLQGYDCTNSSRTMTSSSKGIKSQGDMTISGGTFNIRTSQTGAEGIEGKSKITISGGEFIINAYDDAINSRRDLTISGGKIYAYSSNNDGIDVNGLCWCGSLFISGGTVVTAGTTGVEGGTDGDFEYTNGRTHFRITGGTFIGVGGHAETPTSTTTQRALRWNATGSFSSGEIITIKPQSGGGTDVMSFRMPRQYSGMQMVFSSPDMRASTQYTIYKGNNNVTGGTTFQGLTTGGTSGTSGTQTQFNTNSVVTTVGNACVGWCF